MKHQFWIGALGWACFSSVASAQDRFPEGATNDSMLQRRNRFSLKGTFNFGIKTDFTTVTPNHAGTGAGVGGQNRTYDDGFVKLDVNANAGGMTWNWGYVTAGQYGVADLDPVIPQPGNSLSFHTVTSLAEGATRGGRERMQTGVELAYEEVLGRFHITEKRRANVGLLVSFGYLPLKQRDSATLAGPVTLRTDKYNATLVPPPGPGGVINSGSFDVPGPFLPDAPLSSIVGTVAATGTLNNKLDGALYGFNLGPFIELPLHDSVSLTLGGGLGVVYASTTYSFSEVVAVPGIVTATRSGHISASDWLFSATMKANLHVALGEAWSWELGMGYQYAGSSRSSVQGKSANLKLDGILSLNTGLNYAF